MQEVIQIVKDEISTKKLYQQVKEVSCYHRIQASNGYHQAAIHCVDYLKSLNIDAKLLSYEANGTDYAGSYKLFKEWNIQKAYCDITFPIEKRIADFSIEPISIIQKSYPTDCKDIEVILMDRGSTKDAYQDIDFRNKIIFVHESFKDFTWAIQECGAIGYISDYYNEVPLVRNREEMQDSLNYTSFWWKHTKDEVPAFGYVLSPREGKQLTKLCENTREQFRKQEVKSPYIRVNAFVDSKIFDGKMDVVEATLPGKKEDAILMIAHLCHPCASANDNASGVSGGMEVLRAISQAIQKDKLTQLEYTIKLILVPEFTGTYSYLFDGKDLTKFIAGINLDMIGGKQEHGYGPITISNLPHALPSFVDTLATSFMEEIKKNPRNEEEMEMSLVHTLVHPFQLGSDHTVLSDPFINIPCIMLGQWPDKNYHTSTDTLDKIDPVVLKYSTALAASYVYALANSAFSIDNVVLETRLQLVNECNHIMKAYPDKIKKMSLEHLREYYIASLKTAYQYVNKPVDEIQLQHITTIINMYETKKYQESYTKEYQNIPQRIFTSPIVDVEDLILENKTYQKVYHDFQKEHPIMSEEHDTLQTICDYYVDGKRTIQEIYESVKAETGMSEKEDILAYITIMKTIQYMK